MGFQVSGALNCDECKNMTPAQFDGMHGDVTSTIPKGWSVKGTSVLCPIHAPPPPGHAGPPPARAALPPTGR